MDDYTRDTEIMSDKVLPPLVDFDTVYYSVENDDEEKFFKGTVKTLDVFTDKLDIRTIGSNAYEFTLDTGGKKYEFVAKTKFIA